MGHRYTCNRGLEAIQRTESGNTALALSDEVAQLDDME